MKKTYEKHHHVTYTVAALEAAVRLSDRYISSRLLPDKAIDIMDEAGARARIHCSDEKLDLEAENQKLEDAIKRKNKAVASQKFEEAAKYRDREHKIMAEIEEKKSAFAKNINKKCPHMLAIKKRQILSGF